MAASGRFFFCILATITLKTIHAQTCNGCINLDEYSFNKVVSKFKYTLIKYDNAYPYGPAHDAFIQFANSLTRVTSLIVAEIGIKDYGQRENEAFAKQQDVDTKKLPVIKLYKGTQDVISTFSDEVTVDNLRDFVLDQSNIHITLPGCIEELDELAMQFVNEKDANILKQVEEFVTDNEKTRNIYLLYMKKLLEDGDFVMKENQRLKKILLEGKIASGIKLDIENKINILHSFKDKTKLNHANDVKQEL